MKRIIGFMILLTSFCETAQSQELYKKIYDDPEDVIKGHVGVEFYGVDVGFSNLTGAMLFVFGVNGSYTINDRIQAEAQLRTPLLRFEKHGTGFIFDAGATLNLSSSTTDKNVNVVLGYKEEDLGNGYESHTTKYVPIYGSVKKTIQLRGGVYLKNTGLEYKEGNTDYKPTTLFHKGIYLGIGKQRQYFFQLQRNNNGSQTHFGAGSIFKPYFDVLILPTAVDVEVETFGFGAGGKKELSGFVGGRVGFKWYRNPFTRSQNNEHRIPFFGNCIVQLDAGVRPIDGFFFNGAITYIIKKF